MRFLVILTAITLVGCANQSERPDYLTKERMTSPYVAGLPEEQSYNPLMEDFERTYGQADPHSPKSNPAPYQKPYRPWIPIPKNPS